MSHPMIGEQQETWLGYEAHVGRQRGFKVRKPSVPLSFGPLTAAFLIGIGLGAGATAWLLTRRGDT
ncbi:MAG TPA: hypothetical protein VFA38_07155 [Nitrospirales bacterium]|nr:hypothetical protein [Nitrospirales bacterium]